MSTKPHIRLLAFGCTICPVCICARRWPRSRLARMVARIEKDCPMCRAYRQVHGSHADIRSPE